MSKRKGIPSMIEQPDCPTCDNSGWVCENHPDVPWDDGDADCCGGAGMPCRDCNPCDAQTPPRLPAGSRVIWTKDDRLH